MENLRNARSLGQRTVFGLSLMLGGLIVGLAVPAGAVDPTTAPATSTHIEPIVCDPSGGDPDDSGDDIDVDLPAHIVRKLLGEAHR